MSVDELLVGIAISSGLRPVSDCAAFDTNNDGLVTVNEIVAATNNLLNGCS